MSERVTVIPLDHRSLTLHAPSIESAVEDIALALDDRIARAHPRHVARFAQSTDGDALTVEVPVLPVWNAEGNAERCALVFQCLARPANPPFTEVFVPRLDLRFWVDGAHPVAPQVAPLLHQHLARLGDHALLALRPEGPETFDAFSFETATPVLATLRRRELRLDERPPPAAPDSDEPEPDDWEEDVRAKRRAEADEEKRKHEKPRTPTLRRLGVALHELAAKNLLPASHAVGARVAALLTRVEQDPPDPVLLVGEAGVGKSAILTELARAMARRDGPVERRERPVFQLDASRLIAGDGSWGGWQEQLYAVLDEARRAKAVLILGHIVELLDAGRSAHSDHNVAQVLGPVLAAREVTVLGEATPEAWARLQRRNQSFAAQWSVVQVDEPPDGTVKTVLGAVANDLAARHSMRLADDVVPTAFALVKRFWPYGSSVGNGVTFLRRTLDGLAHDAVAWVEGAHVVNMFSGESGIPAALLRDDAPLDPAVVRAFLSARVMSQPAAVDRVVDVVAVIKAALNDRKRPVAVLFFAGPTGVGKTELSRALAEYLFGSRDRMVRLDMGEYLGPDALARLMGDGETAGHLPTAVRRQPFSVVLLDEIEKAHPAVFDALLGVLGEGRLTDHAGRFTDFRNAVIILTSNLGADTLRSRVGFGGDVFADPAAVRAHYLAEAQRFFRPELFNRLDEVVVFQPLGEAAIRSIVRREVDRITRREGMRRHDVFLTVDDPALDQLAARGLDPRYGARPLKRALERDVTAPVAQWIADHRDHGAVQLAVTCRDEALSLAATTMKSGAKGTRAAAERVLDQAADLRALMRRWTRSQRIADLRREVSHYDRASRIPSFWKDHALAQRATSRAHDARALLDALAEIQRGAEASEDLAFEAWYRRAGEEVQSLAAELVALDARFQPLRETIYTLSSPDLDAVTLYTSAGRGASEHVGFLHDTWMRWAHARNLSTLVFTAMYIDPKERPGTRKDDPAYAYKWVPGGYVPTESPPAGTCLSIWGSRAVTLLLGEQGMHRIQNGVYSGSVSVMVRPGKVVSHDQPMPVPAMLRQFPQGEVRRYFFGRSEMVDARMEKTFAMDSSRVFPLDAVLTAWIEHVVLGGDDAWS